MAEITKRAELFDLMEGAAGAGPIGVVINRMIDAMDAAGLAVVLAVPTKEMEAAAKDYKGSFHKWIHMVRAGNLLKEK